MKNLDDLLLALAIALCVGVVMEGTGGGMLTILGLIAGAYFAWLFVSWVVILLWVEWQELVDSWRGRG